MPRLAYAAVAAALVLAACAGESPAAGPDSGESVSDETNGAPAEGAHEGRLIRLDAGALTVDLVEVLSGADGAQAAREDGELADGGDLPNDVYVRDPDATTYDLAVADDVEVTVYDCTSDCEPLAVAYGHLVSGAQRAFNGSAAVWRLDVTGGRVAALHEIYLP